jgi:hypothetical protein
MTVPALGHIGPVDPASVQPIRAVPPVGSGRNILVRPAVGVAAAGARPAQPDRVRRDVPAGAPRRGTADQSNADGDTATFKSRVGAITGDEHAELSRLRDRDAEVRTHERAHLSAAGGLARGGANYDFQTGPDGEKYAVGGHVSIDTIPGATPQETIARARRMKQAALAPADPSGADRAVAARAMRMEAQARREMTRSTRTAPASAASAPALPADRGNMLDLIA